MPGIAPGVSALFLAHAAATLFMAGVIWFVQLVHYPLFGRVGLDGFAVYEADHTRRTTWVVGPPMLVEALTALLLLWRRPASVTALQVWIGLVLLGLIWLSTALIQVPRHQALGIGYNADAHRVLVASNWLRTIAWSARGGLVLWMLAGVLRSVCPPGE